MTNWSREGYCIGIDIGGTKVVAGLVDADGQIAETRQVATPGRTSQPQVVEDAIMHLVEELTALAGASSVGAVGVGAAGFVAQDGSRIAFAPHLSWRDEPLKAALTRRCAKPVFVDNDANVAAWAEYRFGAARNVDHVLLVALGTGIGGGLVLRGRLERGGDGFAGEFGHMMVMPGGHRCECGNRGCWEQYASGNALVREARTLVAAHSPFAVELSRACGGDPDALTGPMVTQVAAKGDPAACELMVEVGRWLGWGVANLAAAFDPGIVVIGGGLGEAGDLLLAPAREACGSQLTGRGYRPPTRIVAAALGNRAGLIGAADLARGRLLGDSCGATQSPQAPTT